MSLSGSSASRNSIWAMTRLASSSSMNVGRKMIRSLSNREKMSNARSPRGVCSMTIGTRAMFNLSFVVLLTDARVLDEQVERLALAQTVAQGLEVTALLHHTTDGRRGPLTGFGEPLDLGVDVRLAGGQRLLVGNGLQEQGPAYGLLGHRPQLADDLGVVPLD